MWNWYRNVLKSALKSNKKNLAHGWANTGKFYNRSSAGHKDTRLSFSTWATVISGALGQIWWSQRGLGFYRAEWFHVNDYLSLLCSFRTVVFALTFCRKCFCPNTLRAWSEMLWNTLRGGLQKERSKNITPSSKWVRQGWVRAGRSSLKYQNVSDCNCFWSHFTQIPDRAQHFIWSTSITPPLMVTAELWQHHVRKLGGVGVRLRL